MSYPWNIPVPANASLSASREAVNDALQNLLARVSVEIVEKSATAAMADDEYFVVCTSGSFNLTLPPAADLEVRPYIVKNAGAGTITLLPNGFDTIDAAPAYLLTAQNQAVMVYPDGTNWIVAAETGSAETADAKIFELDGAGFDDSTTFFANAIPVQPDLSGGKKVVLLQRGMGALRQVASSPGVGEFALSGDLNRDITYGKAPEPGDWVLALLASVTTSTPPRYLYLTAFLGPLYPGATFNVWSIPAGISGTLEVDADGSYGHAKDVATDGDGVFPLLVNDVEVGTVTFADGDASPTFSVATAVPIVSTDWVEAENPSPANATLARVSITLRITLDE